MKCDIIIPVWNQMQSTKNCIESILSSTNHPIRLILINNASDNQTASYLKNIKDKNADTILINNDRNLGYIKAINQGLRSCDADYICLMNNDTIVSKGWLDELIRFNKHRSEYGLLNPLCKGHKEHSMSVDEYGSHLQNINQNKFMEMNQCQGYCMFLTKEVFNKVGFLDEVFGIGGFDDTDYSMRAYKMGYRCACVYTAYVYHDEHVSFNDLGDRKKIQKASEIAYFKKWPRHLRAAFLFTFPKKSDSDKICNMLKTVLSMARDWCWVNLMIFVDKDELKRVEEVKSMMNFPLHQNIKFRNLKKNIRFFEAGVRLIERSFGTKKRKQYDIIVYNDKSLSLPVKAACFFQKCGFLYSDFNDFKPEAVNAIMSKKREKNV